MEMSGIEGEVGLVAGRSQREKRRSYKDLLREEEEIAAQDSELIVMGGDLHKKKKKHLSDEYHYREHHGSGPPHKKKRKSSERSPSRSSSCSSQPAHSTDTAMGLLQAITSPTATGSEPGPNFHKKPSYPPHSSHSSSKDRKREGSSKSGHSFSNSRHPSSLLKKHSSSSSSSKSSLFHAGAGRGEPLTLRDGEGLKMKLILSPKEKSDGGESTERFPFPAHPSSGNKGHHSFSGSKKIGTKKEKDRDRLMPSKLQKKKQHSREPLPMVGKEVEVEGLYGGTRAKGADCSSSGGELEAGELIIDDSYTQLSSKKKKKSKKSKKKKDKEKDRDKDKSSKEKKHNKGGNAEKKGFKGDSSRSHSHSHSSSNHSTSVGSFSMVPTITLHPQHHQGADLMTVKKKKKEEKEREKHDKEKKKKKSTTAYQVFCKEYRVNINAEQPGLVFGELSKKLAEVWKHLPEKDKQVWKQKAQYLQHKQIKAEATTVKQKTLSSENKIKSSNKVVGMGTGLTTPSRALTIRVPEVDPIDAAAHLQLLGESLSLIGHRLQETEGMVAVSGSLSVLLDSILCALGPLTCLTAQVPQLNGCPRSVLSSTLDNIAYIMPGL